MKKICFVIMGFGKKMDYRNSKEVNMDLIYQYVIQELFKTEFEEYEVIRADEISGSAIIDVSMYTLLINADLVIADITTLNENAIYELGVRHALKPYSTIIMMQNSDKTKAPFDLNHCRVLLYKDYGEKLSMEEAKVIKHDLKKFVIASEEQETDSPFYTYLPNVNPPRWNEKRSSTMIEDIKKKEDNIAIHRERAEKLKRESNFVEAIAEWKILKEMLPDNEYVTQQLALAYYKSEYPNKTMALQSALKVINTLNPERTLDLETLGITGAIYKRLYRINNNYDYLDKAIEMYRKGYMISNDYYNGENYSNCLLFKTQKKDLDKNELGYLRFESRKTYGEIVVILEESIKTGEVNRWMYATLSTSYKVLEDEQKYQEYRKLFEENAEADWEIESYQDNLERITKCLS